MICLYSITSSKYACFFIALMASFAANASLLDCSKNMGIGLHPDIACKPAEAATNNSPTYILKEPAPAVITATNSSVSGFHVHQSRSSGAFSGSAPLIGLICALLGVVLLRAKSCNTK